MSNESSDKREEKAKDKKEIIIKSKNKNEKYPLKELTQLKNYQNYRILNADKKGKKKTSFLQNNKFSIDTLTYSFSSFNPKSNIFQKSELFISQNSNKKNNISSFTTENLRIKEYFQNIEFSNNIMFDRYEKQKLFFSEEKNRNIHLNISKNKKNKYDFNKDIKPNNNQSAKKYNKNNIYYINKNKSLIGNRDSEKENKITSKQDNNKSNDIKNIKEDNVKKFRRIDNNNRDYIQDKRKKEIKNEDIKDKENENDRKSSNIEKEIDNNKDNKVKQYFNKIEENIKNENAYEIKNTKQHNNKEKKLLRKQGQNTIKFITLRKIVI